MQSWQKHCHAQGVPEDFLTRNEQFASASAQHKPGQVQYKATSPNNVPSHAGEEGCGT